MPRLSSVLSNVSTKTPWYRHRWPWLLMLGPFLVIVAGSYTAWIAITQQDALVVDDYYTQGKAINLDLRRDRVATDLGVRFSARYDTATGMLSGLVSNTAKQPIGKINVHLIHATLPEKDITLKLQPDRAGYFETTLSGLEMGRWQLLIENEQRDWRLNSIWTWPAQQDIDIEADEAVKK